MPKSTNPRDVGYPGHPILICLQIMEAFPSYEDAAKPTEHGWPSALSTDLVNGAGGAVYQALDVLKRMKGGLSAAEAFDLGARLWRQAREGGDFREKLAEGQMMADKVKDLFIARAGRWFGEASTAPGMTMPQL